MIELNEPPQSRREYYEHVERTAEVLIDETDPERPLVEAVDEAVDSDRLIMMTRNHLPVLMYSDEEPHDWRVFVRDDAGYKQVIQAMAYTTYRQDVMNELRERGAL